MPYMPRKHYKPSCLKVQILSYQMLELHSPALNFHTKKNMLLHEKIEGKPCKTLQIS